jgi:hypothetical protein
MPKLSELWTPVAWILVGIAALIVISYVQPDDPTVGGMFEPPWSNFEPMYNGDK